MEPVWKGGGGGGWGRTDSPSKIQELGLGKGFEASERKSEAQKHHMSQCLKLAAWQSAWEVASFQHHRGWVGVPVENGAREC